MCVIVANLNSFKIIKDPCLHTLYGDDIGGHCGYSTQALPAYIVATSVGLLVRFVSSLKEIKDSTK